MANDLKFLGEITLDASIAFPENSWNYNKLTWLDHNGATQRIYLIPENEEMFDETSMRVKNFIYVNDGISLQTIGRIALEDFITMDDAGLLFPTSNLPKYVFSNSDGTKIHVLSKPLSSRINDQWELQTIDIECQDFSDA